MIDFSIALNTTIFVLGTAGSVFLIGWVRQSNKNDKNHKDGGT